MKTKHSIFILLIVVIIASLTVFFTTCKGQGKNADNQTESQQEIESTEDIDAVSATEGVIENNTYKAKYFGLTFRYSDTFKYSESAEEGEEQEKQELVEPIKTEGTVTFYYDDKISEGDDLSDMMSELSKKVNNVEIIYIDHEGMPKDIINAFIEGREKNSESYGEDGAKIDQGKRNISGKEFSYHMMTYKHDSEVVDAMYFTVVKGYIIIFKTLSNLEKARTEMDKMIDGIQFS